VARALWIFGYGSLVWRPAFAHVESRPATIRGFRRLFWQGSTDHRGVPGAPGRVVTVLPEADAECAGRVYRVDPAAEREVLAGLDQREQGGYERYEVEAWLTPGEPDEAGEARPPAARVSALMYAATPGNRNYLGPAPLDAIARQVCASRGPSGHNVDYVLELAAALRVMGARDAHVFELESLVHAGRRR
jgi:cation transport regulator ChaC